MREILFRGKNVDSDKWHYGYYVNQYGAHEIYMPDGTDDSGFDRRHIIPETLGQYTGMTDKNGKKIFEGDIISFTINAFGYVTSRIGEVYYSDNYSVFFIKATTGRRYNFSVIEDIKVIGNIHDSPELMKGE